MFNLVVLCTFVAAAAASGIVPLTYSAAVISPATTTFSSQASSVIHPSPLISTPLVYSSPLYSHFIKKRSAVFAPSIIAPSTYIARTPLVTSYAAPWTSYSVAAPVTAAIATPFYGAHLIKKRSAVFAPTIVAPSTYIARTPLVTSYAAPWASTYSVAAPVTAAIASPFYGPHFIKKRSASLHLHSSFIRPAVYTAPIFRSSLRIATPLRVATPYYSAPIAYSGHFIKKRSLAVASYIAPAAVSHQSRVDFRSTPAVVSTSYTAPLVYSRPLIPHYF